VVLTGKALIWERNPVLIRKFSEFATFCRIINFFDGIYVSTFKMVIIDSNLLPLMITAGLMGYFGIPLNHQRF
jgi:hypothetical protein